MGQLTRPGLPLSLWAAPWRLPKRCLVLEESGSELASALYVILILMAGAYEASWAFKVVVVSRAWG